ncbi:MAG: hypothetical protein ACE5GK_12325 [Nitrospiria bacterium]
MIDPEDKDENDRRIRWLLSFQHQDLKGVSEEGLRGVIGQLLGCSYAMPAGQSGGQPLRIVNFDDHGFEKPPNLTKRQVQAIQKKLRDGIDILMSEGKDPVGLGPDVGAWKFLGSNAWNIKQVQYKGVTVIRHPGGRWISLRPNIEFPGAFWLSVATLLAEAGRRLQRCPECKTIFLAKTSRKSCCSNQCSQKGRNRRFMEKKSSEEKYEIRRAIYVRQVDKKLKGIKPERRGPRKKKGGS